MPQNAAIEAADLADSLVEEEASVVVAVLVDSAAAASVAVVLGEVGNQQAFHTFKNLVYLLNQ